MFEVRINNKWKPIQAEMVDLWSSLRDVYGQRYLIREIEDEQIPGETNDENLQKHAQEAFEHES